MSGSTRAITLTLSVRDAATVKQELERIGPAGEAALQRLEAAAQRANSGGGGSGSGGMVGLRTAIGQAGFQIQDFAVQVQGGTNALTALSQQGSQLLGVFGPAGAMAGAALTIGLLAVQLLGIGGNAEEARKQAEAAFKGMSEAAEATRNVLADINSLFLSTAEAAAAAGNAYVEAARVAAIAQQSIAVQQQEGAVSELPLARRELATQQALSAATLNRRIQSLEGRRAAANGTLAEFMAPYEEQARQDLFRFENRVEGLEQFIGRQGARAGQLAEQLDRLNRFGRYDADLPSPPVPPAGGSSGADNSIAAAGASAAAAAERERQANAQRAMDAAVQSRAEDLRDYAAALRAVETPMERHTRRMEELSALQVRLQENRTPMRPEDDARLVAAIDKELADAENRTGNLNSAARELGMTFSSAFEDAIIKGEDLRKVLDGVAQDLARIILRQAVVNPLASAAGDAAKGVGSWLGSQFSSTPAVTPSALGNAFSNGRLIPFASGGMVDRATVVPMALMGEAGPEAIMPLRRGKDGKLGVAASGGDGGGIVQHITIDARGADPSVVPLIQAAMEQAKRQAKAELLAEIQRGGQAAKIVGRR